MKKFNYFLTTLILFSTSSWSATGMAIIKGTTAGSDLNGTVKLEDTKKGLKITATLDNVPPGKHGFHIHTYGSCADNGTAAGGHFNPGNRKHGHAAKEGLKKAHVGDLGNVTIGSNWKGSLETVLKGVSLQKGKNAVVGRAFIVHAKPDDFGQPTGNAGGRIGCGAIFLTND